MWPPRSLDELDRQIERASYGTGDGRRRVASCNACRIYVYLYASLLARVRSYDVDVPNKTIYVSDGDLPLYQRAQELAGDNLSAAISAALRRYVDVEEGRREGFDEIIVRVGPGKGRKVRFTGVLLGEWVNSSSSRVETFRVYRGRTGKFVLHVERSAGLHDGRRRGQAGRLARLSRASATSATGTRPASRPSRSSRRSRSSASGSRRSSTTWSPARPSSPRSKTSTSEPRRHADPRGGAA